MQNFDKSCSDPFQLTPDDKTANLATIRRFCREPAMQECQIACFPEMCVTRYSHVRNLSRKQIGSLSQIVADGPTTQSIAEFAKEYEFTTGDEIIEISNTGEYHNTYDIDQPYARIDKRRKLNCFVSECKSSGDRCTVIERGLGIKLSVLICYINKLIENVRLTVLKGTDIFLDNHQTGGVTFIKPGNHEIHWSRALAKPESHSFFC